MNVGDEGNGSYVRLCRLELDVLVHIDRQCREFDDGMIFMTRIGWGFEIQSP